MKTRLLAVLRPVFRGLRRKLLQRVERAQEVAPCSAETRFQGIATQILGANWAYGPRMLAVLRPVFRGLRLTTSSRNTTIISPPACSAETRFQGIATEGHHLAYGLRLVQPCSAETRFQGIATLPGGCNDHLEVISSCSAETRFQGIATRILCSTMRASWHASCSAETRFQGIATHIAPPPTWKQTESLLAVLRPVFRGLRRG